MQWKPYTQLAVTIIADNNFQPDNPQDTGPKLLLNDSVFFDLLIHDHNLI